MSVTVPPIASQMLSSLEFLHYCRRFKDQLFSFCFASSRHCTTLLMDLRVLHAAGIQQLVITPDSKELRTNLQVWLEAEENFELIMCEGSGSFVEPIFSSVKQVLASGRVPVVLVEECRFDKALRESLCKDVFRISREVNARKIFFSIDEKGLTVGGVFRSYPSGDLIRAAVDRGEAMNLSTDFVEALVFEQELSGIDTVLVEANRGSIFEEVFTHSGSGTLFSSEYSNELRWAKASDMRELLAIMAPQIADGSLTHVSEERLLGMISSFMVYTVNAQIVAGAALADYGDSSELIKLCTLPRYQAKGRARALVEALLETAKGRGQRDVFALTIHTHVGDFFERIGFLKVSRDELPEEWKVGYSLSRPSIAYRYTL